MKNYTFGFEVQTLLEQFIGAFNDVIIKRYDNENKLLDPQEGFKVLYVYSPKQRVYSSLKDPAPGGLTVPCIAVQIASIARDQARVFNKNEGFNIESEQVDNTGQLVRNILQPVPVNITVNMTIITKYQLDMDQILNNFIPYTDPYIIISWKIPNITDSQIPYEIRSEVLWSGNINLQYPSDLGPTQPYRLTADTSFTIKGWLFKKVQPPIQKIYKIRSDYFDGLTDMSTRTNLLTSLDDYYGPIL